MSLSVVIAHKFNGIEVLQTRENYTAQGVSIPKGHVCITRIAKAHKVWIGRYLKSDRVSALVKLLEAEMQKSNSVPVIVLKGGENGGETWVCAEIAIDFCTRISAELHLWSLETLLKVVRDEPITQSDRDAGKELIAAIDPTLSNSLGLTSAEFRKDIDRLERILGSLEADVSRIARTVGNIDRTADEIEKMVNGIEQTVDGIEKSID